MSRSESLKPTQWAFYFFIRIIGLMLAIPLLIRLSISYYSSKNRQYFWTPKLRTSKPKCLTDPTLGRHSFAQLKDVKLHYVEAGDRSKPLMLCLHGFPECWYSWKYQLQFFSKNYWVVAVDMRGYGESDKPQGKEHYKVSILVEDVRQLISKLGRDKCILMCHDWGGLVGWTFAALHPEMLIKLVAINVPHPATATHYLKTTRQCITSWYFYFFQTPWIPELFQRSRDNGIFNLLVKRAFKPEDSQEAVEAYKYYYSQPGAWSGPIHYYRGLFDHPSSPLYMTDQELRVKVPSLLVFGQRDKFIDYRMVPDCSRHVHNFQYKLIENGSHWAQIDSSDEVNQIVSNFL